MASRAYEQSAAVLQSLNTSALHMALSKYVRTRENAAQQQEGDEEAVGCLVLLDKFVKPLPCLHVLATDAQRELWEKEARVRTEQEREEAMVEGNRRAAMASDKTQRHMRKSEDSWRVATAQVQQKIFRKCLLEERQCLAALTAHRAAAERRDKNLRLDARRGDGVRRAVCEMQARKLLSWREKDHAAAAAGRDALQRADTLRQDASRLASAQKQDERRAQVQRAEEEAAMEDSMLEKHASDARRRLQAQSEQARLREHRRKGIEMKQQQAFLDACRRANEKAREEELMASHHTSRLSRERALRSQAAALEEVRRAESEQQQAACDAAVREQEELARALQRRAAEERQMQMKAAVMKLEAAKREKAAQITRQKEQSATNRMSAMKRDRARHHEVKLDVDRRLEVCLAQEHTRQRAAAQEREKEQVAEHQLASEARELRQRELALREGADGGWRRESAERQERMCDNVRVREAQRREVREAALKSLHGLKAERREAAARKEALSYEGKGGLREGVAQQQNSTLQAAQELEHEQERAREREVAAAREAEQIEANAEAQHEREMLERQRVVESMWDLRAVAIRQDEACGRLQAIESEAAQRETEAVAAHRLQAQERDNAMRADVLESDWIRKAVCVSQEEVWQGVWSGEQEERKQQQELVAALCAEHRRASEDRDTALCDEALESTWKYRAQALKQEDKREQVQRVEAEAAEAQRRVQEEQALKAMELEGLWKAESQRREEEERELVVESDWMRRAVATEQEEVWKSKCQEEVKEAVQSRVEPEAEEEEKKRVREKVVKLEALARNRAREAAQEKERCAENRMSARMREKMQRDEVDGDVGRRAAVSGAQKEEWHRAEGWDKKDGKRVESEEPMEHGEKVQGKQEEQMDGGVKEIKVPAQGGTQQQEVEKGKGEEDERRRRVRETTVRMEAVARNKAREVAREKERCAENRMSARMREKMQRDEMDGDIDWRAAVSGAQEERRGLVETGEQARAQEAQEKGDSRDGEPSQESIREAKLLEMYREREEVVAEEKRRAAALEAMEKEREILAHEVERQKEEEAHKAAELRVLQAAEEKVRVQEDFERMKERAVAKLEEEEAKEPTIYGSEEMEEEIKHILMAETDELRAPVDAAIEQMQPFGRAVDDFVFASDPKTVTQEQHPAIARAEADAIKFGLPSDVEDEMWLDRDRALEELLDLNDMSDSQTDVPDPAPASPFPSTWFRLPSVVTWYSSAARANKLSAEVQSSTPKLPAETAPGGAPEESKVVLVVSNVPNVDINETALPQSSLNGDEIQFVGPPEIVESKPVDEDLVMQLLSKKDEARRELQVVHPHPQTHACIC